MQANLFLTSSHMNLPHALCIDCLVFGVGCLTVNFFIRCDDNRVARKKMRFNVVPAVLKGAPGFGTSYSLAEHYVINSDTLTMPLCLTYSLKLANFDAEHKAHERIELF